MASLKPKLFCGVAFRMKGGLTLQARRRWNNWPWASRDACNLRHNTCQSTVSSNQSGNASTPTEPTGRCTLQYQTVSPKRETIRVKALTVKRRGLKLGGREVIVCCCLDRADEAAILTVVRQLSHLGRDTFSTSKNFNECGCCRKFQ